MKRIFAAFLLFVSSTFVLAQTAGPNKKIQYAYQVSQASEEELIQLTEKLNASTSITNCKYHFKPERNTGEIIFITEEKPIKSEHDTSNDLPNVKNMIMEAGMHYEGVTIHEIQPEN